jgi:hypothetical protein
VQLGTKTTLVSRNGLVARARSSASPVAAGAAEKRWEEGRGRGTGRTTRSCTLAELLLVGCSSGATVRADDDRGHVIEA